MVTRTERQTSPDIRVYYEFYPEQQQQEESSHLINFDIDYWSGKLRNSLHTAVHYAKLCFSVLSEQRP
ncbi:10037_t:CDS:2 [Diversispora eburnea]|uniref:10037_t:CDS:1 n=1 Tax=Diversispora eburnea TaxID=1213867 RepID=A0A9N8WSY2_9GLOM|nr:10037_t:CDS:2 [Diversispora eburnea]